MVADFTAEAVEAGSMAVVVGVVDSMAVVAGDTTVAAGVIPAAVDTPTAAGIVAADPQQCRGMVARMAEMVGMHAALMVVHHMHKVVTVEAVAA